MTKAIKIKADKMSELEKFGYEQADYNEKYLIKYIPDSEVDMPKNYYRTLYVNKETRELFAYHEYYDERIQIQDEWINDLITAGLTEVVDE